jgi:hypothetical protein
MQGLYGVFEVGRPTRLGPTDIRDAVCLIQDVPAIDSLA